MTEQLQTTPMQPPEVIAQQEQQLRAEMLNTIAAESVGTVGLYTTMDLKPDEKAQMAAVQQARGSESSDRLTYSAGGGWGEYGERKCGRFAKTNARELEGEEVQFVQQEDGNVDVRYAFGHGGRLDGTGRPGNVMNVWFTLPKDSAAKLREAIHADPSFIQDVTKRQVGEIGIDTEGTRWNSSKGLKPSYYGSHGKSQFQLGVEDKDRVLKVIDAHLENGDEPIEDAQEVLAYGEKKSLAPLLPKAAEVAPLDQATAPSEVAGQATLLTKQELAEQRFEEELAFEWQDVASDRTAGKSTQAIIDRLEGEIQGYLDGEAAAEAAGSNTEPFDRAYRVAAEVQRELMAELKAEKAEAERKQGAVGEAQANLAAVHAEMVGPTVNSNVMHGGRQYQVVELYEGKDAQKTQWATLKSGTTEITVKASEL